MFFSQVVKVSFSYSVEFG